MSQIITGLWLGSFQEATDDKWLRRKNIKNVVNCAIEHDNYFEDVGKIKYLKLAMEDAPDQKLNYAVAKAFRFIESALDRGESVLVHCHAGISRSASIVIYFLMRKFGGGFDEVLNYTRSKREQVDPNEGFQYFLSNIKFKK